MIRAVDEWAEKRGRSDVIAQIAAGTYVPTHIKFINFIDPSEFRRRMEEARVVVAHAGMGSIISALELGKPIVVMPRRARLRETRNDHQVAAAKHFSAQGRVILANDENDLPERIDQALTLRDPDRIESQASPQLIDTIQIFLDGSSGDRNAVASVDPLKSNG